MKRNAAIFVFVMHNALTRHNILKRETYTLAMHVPSRYHRQDRLLIVLIHLMIYSDFRMKANGLLRLCVCSDHIGLVHGPPYLENTHRNACNTFFISLRLKVTRWVVVVRPWV